MKNVMVLPTEEMIRTAQEIRTLLDKQWNTHSSHYGTFTSLISALSSGLPAGQRQDTLNHADHWQQQMQQQYASLYKLADALEKGAVEAEVAEGEITQTFKP